MRNSKSAKKKRLEEIEEIEHLNSWIQSQKPNSGFNPMSLPPLPSNSPIGLLRDNTFSCYSGATLFKQLPISQKTKDGLRQCNYHEMTDIQRATFPHALCGRDILGAAKTGSGKTLAFVIPVLEKLYRERWGPEDGVGCIIISPTRELAGQLFDVLKSVGKHHNFSAGLLIGGRKDVDVEKQSVGELNILVCTPGRLLQHMDETPNFDCSQLQVLVLDEADRILDVGFKKALNAILSQLPKRRQTFLFSATQTKSVQDLARLSLKDPEYLSVHEESVTATPTRLQQTAIIVSLDEKLDMLWSFIKAHINSKILVFLSSCKQVKFVFDAFKKLRPGIPLMCLHGRMKLERRMGVYLKFCEYRSILFCTDVASRGLDFNKAVDWVVQVDCPEDVASYIHRVGRTARYHSGGRSVLFLMPSEIKMLEKLQAAKIPIQSIKANTKRLQPVSGLLSALLVKYPDMQYTAQRAFLTYLRSIHIQKDKEIFDVLKLPVDKFSASMGLPLTPKIRFLNKKSKQKSVSENPPLEPEMSDKENELGISREELDDLENPREELDIGDFKEVDRVFLPAGETSNEEGKVGDIVDIIPETRVLKKKKLKINIHRPVGTRVVFDEEGNTLQPLARIADTNCTCDSLLLDQDKKEEYYKKMREQLRHADLEDKRLDRERRRQKRIKDKMKWTKNNFEEEEEGESGLEEEEAGNRRSKRSKIYFDSDNDDGERKGDNVKASISLEEQEALALKLLSSMHQ
ncbi:hypothetical protein FNV43_RR13323 [Rhamnella rubrinervis]|uniref:ATP-dependent RNA helicase n=1 Tax=Rhamnella rubrinervis TaxID=2594499 RepID=A0A8K0MF69_9ROSA|nr:hypothetical protein FNV43_RR13323 [Rhamnella rubrinervis]